MFQNLKILLFITFTALVFAACIETPDFDIVPEIEFVGMTKDTLNQGVFQEDSLTVVFTFKDGDGDLGDDSDAAVNNVFFIDTRTDFEDNSFRIPFIPEEGSANGIEGTVRISLFTTCCIFPDGADPCTPSSTYPYDTVQYRIYITDRAGNKSNEIITDPIILRCN